MEMDRFKEFSEEYITYIVMNTNKVITYIIVRWQSSLYVKDRIAAKKEKFNILKGSLGI